MLNNRTVEVKSTKTVLLRVLDMKKKRSQLFWVVWQMVKIKIYGDFQKQNHAQN